MTSTALKLLIEINSKSALKQEKHKPRLITLPRVSVDRLSSNWAQESKPGKELRIHT